MPVNYAEVYKDLEAREGQLITELNTIKSGKPAIKLLMEQQQAQAALNSPKQRFAGVGTKAALREILSDTPELFSRERLHDLLKSDGWTTNSSDPLSVLSATLSQLTASGELEKIEDRWRKSQRPRIELETGIPLPEDRPVTTLSDVYRSAGAPDSLVESQRQELSNGRLPPPPRFHSVARD